MVDNDGNKTQVRFSRKTKEQYLASITDEGKQTKWAAYYNKDTNSWTISELKARSTTTKKSTSSSTTKMAAKASAKSATKTTTRKSTTKKTTK